MVSPVRFTLISGIFLLIGTVGVMAQIQPNVIISPSPTPLVRLASFSMGSFSALRGLNSSGPLANSIVVLTNQSDEAIVAVSAGWRILTSTGTERRFKQKCDIFLAAGVGKVIVAPHANLYLSPNTCMKERSPSVDLVPAISAIEGKTFEALGDISEIDISVDAIMFEKGDMFAADSAYGDEIQSRVAAAKELSAYVRAALASGQTTSQALAGLSSSTQSRAGEQGAWLRDFAAFMSRLSGQAFFSYLASLDRITAPAIRVHNQ